MVYTTVYTQKYKVNQVLIKPILIASLWRLWFWYEVLFYRIVLF